MEQQSEQHRDSELLKSFRSDVQDGGRLENAPKPQVRLSPNLVGGIGVTWRFRIAKLVHGGQLQNLETTSALEWLVRLS